MLKIKNFLVTNKILAVCLAILMSVSFAFAANWYSNQTDCFWYQSNTYYSDASHTTQVGVKTWFCDGLVGRAGTITQYYTTSYCDCIPE